MDIEPDRASESLAKYLRNDPSDEGYDPNRPRDPGAHTYNGPDYADREPGGPVWMTNVMGSIGDRDTTLSITLDGMPNGSGRKANWSSPEDIVDAFQTAAQNGEPFNTRHEENYPRRGHGTAWEMSEVAYAVRNYDGAAAWGDPDDERPGRPWEEIKWYTRNEEGGCKEVTVPKPAQAEHSRDTTRPVKSTGTLEVKKFMASNEKARSAAEIVAAEWSVVLSYGWDRIDPAVPRAAYQHPALRELWPMVSHGVLYLSRCTEWPWTDDVGTAYPLAKGGYRVRRESDKTLFGKVDTAEEAYALIAASLPDGCGPAIDGTADDLRSCAGLDRET